MRTYDFDLVLATEPSDEVADGLHEYFGVGGRAHSHVLSVVLGTRVGQSFAACVVKAESFDQALQLVLPGFRGVGVVIERVELDPAVVAGMEAA